MALVMKYPHPTTLARCVGDGSVAALAAWSIGFVRRQRGQYRLTHRGRPERMSTPTTTFSSCGSIGESPAAVELLLAGQTRPSSTPRVDDLVRSRIDLHDTELQLIDEDHKTPDIIGLRVQPPRRIGMFAVPARRRVGRDDDMWYVAVDALRHGKGQIQPDTDRASVVNARPGTRGCELIRVVGKQLVQ